MAKRGQPLRKAKAVRRPAKPAVDPKQRIAELERELKQALERQAATSDENTRLLGELREALDQQTATADVLKVINRSTFDLEPVLDTLAESAARLCSAEAANIWRQDGDVFSAIGNYGLSEDVSRFLKESHPGRGRGTTAGRTVLEGRPIHILDVRQDPEYTWSEAIERAGIRTMLGVPLLREGIPIGAFSLHRTEVRPFTDKQIALVTTFADQAVIAMENARLITETREALEQQTATSEVLSVISSSPGELQLVFEKMLECALRLCNAHMGTINRAVDGVFNEVAKVGAPPEFNQFTLTDFRPPPGSALRRMLETKLTVQVRDYREAQIYRDRLPQAVALVELGRARSGLQVPLLRENEVIGAMTIYRPEVRPFDDKEVALVENFAKQAVIAIENARLITETREALDRQTATAEVLQVINSSPGDLAPVFDAILEKAHSLCGVSQGSLQLYDGETFRAVAVHGPSKALSDRLRQGFNPQRSVGRRLLEGARFVHIPDLAESDDPMARAAVELSGVRTALFIPLRKDGTLLGRISACRQEVKPFTDKQIALLQNFAAQAVIAMENARLITETREALEQQTATADVLQVINSSPGDLAPVFDAMLEKALGLCGAAFGILWTYDGSRMQAAALRGLPPPVAELFLTRGPHPVGPDRAFGRLLRGESVVHVANAAEDQAYRSGDPLRRALVDQGGARTLLGVPLRKDNAMLGLFTIYRQEVRPFSDKEIALVQNFAAQAVIAIENARLITETREALEQQTATSDVLKIISRSSVDLETVLDTLVETVARLCRADQTYMFRRRDDKYHMVASHGLSKELKEFVLTHPLGPDRGTVSGRVALERRAVHIPDVLQDPEFTYGEGQKLAGNRTMLGIPLLREDTLIGIFSIHRTRVEPFTEKEIELATTFADQAVIAIENGRLFDELRDRQVELARSVDELTATGDVLKIISRSSVDLETVLDTLVETVARLCHADQAVMFRRRDDKHHLVAAWGLSEEARQFVLAHPLAPDRGTITGRVIVERRAIHMSDVLADPEYTYTEGQKLVGYRTNLGIPLLRGDELIGIFNINRTRVEPFTNKEIELATTFADQAVIAIENARLFDELRDRQAELRVTFDNMGDGVVMFDAEARLTAWNRNFQQILDLPDAFLAERPSVTQYFRYLADRGEYSADLEAELSRAIEDTKQEMRFERTRPDGRVIEVRRNPVPGGGFVVIFSDITERKRAEAAISAARDAAESALRELQTAQASLVHAQKMAALGQLTAGIAHEIKNPLNFVNNFAGLSVELLDELKQASAKAVGALDADERAEITETIQMLTGNLEKIAEHGRRADGIVKSMLQHSRGGSGDWQAVDLNALVEEALNLAYHGARAQDQSFNITMERELDRNLLPIEVVPQDVMRVFLNLIGNGFYAAHKRSRAGDGTFRPVLKVTTHEGGDAVDIRVRDNGIGIPAEHREKLFQPFFTTKPTGEGTGLGLSISFDIVTQQHGGTITVESEVGDFTEFTVRLPRRGLSAVMRVARGSAS